MPRQNQRITEIINKMVAETVARIAPVMQRQIAAFAAAELEKNLAVSGTPRSRSKYRSRRGRQEITRWAADRRARRVPNFVIELTGGLDTKKKIVAKYGPGVVFEKGRPAPKAA